MPEPSYLEQLKALAQKALSGRSTPLGKKEQNGTSPGAKFTPQPQEPVHPMMGDREDSRVTMLGPQKQGHQDPVRQEMGDWETHLTDGLPLPEPEASQEDMFVREGSNGLPKRGYGTPTASPTHKNLTNSFPGLKEGTLDGKPASQFDIAVERKANELGKSLRPTLGPAAQRANAAIERLQNKDIPAVARKYLPPDLAQPPDPARVAEELTKTRIGQWSQQKINDYLHPVIEIDDKDAQIQANRSSIDNIKFAQEQDQLNQLKERAQKALTKGN